MSVFKKLLLLVTVVGVSSCSHVCEQKKLRILGVGNSFTVNSTKFLPQIIASDEDVSADIGVAYIGGCPMDKHVNLAKIHEANPEDPKGKIYRYDFNGKVKKRNASLKEMLLDGEWDYITIQQVSSKSYKLETFYPYAQDLYDYIKKYAPNATIVMHETWSHSVDCPRVKWWKLTPDQMYTKLHAAYGKVAGELGIEVIPVGSAFQTAKENPLWQHKAPENFDIKKFTDPKDKSNIPDQSKSLHHVYGWGKNWKTGEIEFKVDGYHAGKFGEYLGGMVWYEHFFNKDCRDLTYKPKGFTEEQAKSLRDAAHKTMEATRAERAAKAAKK